MSHSRPLVIAHRGSNEALAEHTLAAYERAIVEGADALECDVRLTADGVAVCVHDRTIERTSDGYGIVSIKSYNDLSEQDFGVQRRRELTDAADVDPALTRLLTLEALLDLVVSTSRPLGIVIETKHPVRYAGLVEERVVAMLRRFGLAEPAPNSDSTATVRMMSFSEIALRRMRSLAPAVPTVFLIDKIPLRSRGGWLPNGARIAGPGLHVVKANPDFVARVHETGNQVYVWTVDDSADVDYCVDLGVDAIISNRPGDVLAHLGSSDARGEQGPDLSD